MLFNTLNIKVKSLVSVVLAIFMSVLAGARIFGVDRDYAEYQKFFEEQYNNVLYDGRFEPGFVFFTKTFIFLANGLHFDFFLGFIAFVSLAIKFSVLFDRRHYAVTVFVYLLTLFPIHEMTQIRVAIATAFSYLGLICMLNGQNIRSFLLFILGVSFHYSTLILLPFYFYSETFCQRKVLWQLIYLIAIPCVMAYLFLDYFVVINPLASIYLSGYEAEPVNVFSVRNIAFFFALALGFISWPELNRENKLFLMMSVFGLMLFITFRLYPVYAHRFLEMSVFSYLLWVVFLPYYKRIIALSIMILSGIYVFYKMLFIDSFFI